MNLSSRTAAGRSRSADGDLFSLQNVVHTTEDDRSERSPASPHAWKRGFQEKIWSMHGPKGMTARSVLALLLWHADANGRVWLGIQAIANKIGAGSLRTVRNALDSLVRQGWLRSTSQTWATLTAEQTAAGRPVPRRGDVGQAPNLYVLLDGSRSAPTSEAPRRPGLARASFELQTKESPGQIDQGSHRQKSRGGPLADVHHDLDPKGSRSKIVSVERVRRVDKGTHPFSKIHDKGSGWVETWNVIVEAHAEKTKATYGLPPLPPDLKRVQQQALAECLDGGVTDLRAKLRDRTSVTRDVHDVRHELITRVLNLYFKRDNEHLRRVKHALRDLPREFHARITEAMQLMLRESHDAQKPRKMQPETQFVETTKPAKSTVPTQPTNAAQVITAREARRLLETLGGAPLLDESVPLSGQDKPALLRPGAPRWGAVSPRPMRGQTATQVFLREMGEESASTTA